MSQRYVKDTVLLGGWLFADLLLGLAIIFFAAIPGAQPRPIVVPTLTVSPSTLTANSTNCSGGITQPRCTVTVGETPASIGNMTWTASSDITNTISFSPAGGNLSPGQSMVVTITNLPCQNGSFTFSGSRGANPVTILWHCVPAQERLDFKYQQFNLTIHDVNGLLNGSQSATNDVVQQIRGQRVLQGGSVGLAIVYAGAPGDNDIGQAQNVAKKVYAILAMLGRQGFAFQRSSYYVPLYFLGDSASTVIVDVYLFK